MAEDCSMQERILKKLEDIITNDRDLRSFSIVVERENLKNKSPILYEDHHLALESWCVKHIYRFAYRELLHQRPLLKKKRLPSSREKSLNQLLIGVLLINPDVSTFWAMKRELVQSEVLNIESELLFSKLVLSHKGKSNETFAYRRWLLQRLLCHVTDSEVFRLLFTSEVIVAEIAAEKSPNNYHALTHRIWCLQNIASRLPHVVRIALYNHELVRSLQWVELHVSENTGYHYRQFLFKLFMADSHTFYFEHYLVVVTKQLEIIPGIESVNFLEFLFGVPKNTSLTVQKRNGWLNYVTLLLYELCFTVERLNTVYRGHETIWYHRRFIVYHLVQAFYEYHSIKHNSLINKAVTLSGANISDNIVNTDISYLGSSEISESGEKQPKMFKSQPVEIESSRLYEILSKSEQKFIAENSNDQSLQGEYSRRHAKWLKFALGFYRI